MRESQHDIQVFRDCHPSLLHDKRIQLLYFILNIIPAK